MGKHTTEATEACKPAPEAPVQLRDVTSLGLVGSVDVDLPSSFLLFGPVVLTYCYWPQGGAGWGGPLLLAPTLSKRQHTLGLNHSPTQAKVKKHMVLLSAGSLSCSHPSPHGTPGAPEAHADLPPGLHSSPGASLHSACPPQSGPARAPTLGFRLCSHSTVPTPAPPGTPPHQVPHLGVSAQAIP